MRWRGLAVALAVVAGLALVASTRAGEVPTVRLGYNSAAPTLTLKQQAQDDDDLVLTRWRGGYSRGFYSGYGHSRGFYSGYGHGYSRGFYPGYGGYGYSRGFYSGYGGYGYSRGFYPGYSYYSRSYAYYAPRSFAFSFGYSQPYDYSYYAPPVYYSPAYYSYAPSYCPISVPGGPMPYADPQGNGGVYTLPQPGAEAAPPGARPQTPADGTYPYDGGPPSPVPMPKAEPAPSNLPKVVVPGDGRIVVLPLRPTPKYSYTAFGEQPARPAAPAERTLVIKNEPAVKK